MTAIIVHGGGPEITPYMERMGMEVNSSMACASPTETVRWSKMGLSARSTLTPTGHRHEPACGRLGGEDGSLFESTRGPVGGRRLRSAKSTN